MALVRTSIFKKLDIDPNFHLKVHRNQMIQIKAVHAQVNDEGKKRLADFTVECSDPDFVLIMENLTLKRVENILSLCNPDLTLEFRMDIGVSKNQIGCADPFGACYVKVNGNRRKNHGRYIPYPTTAATSNNNTTNIAPNPIVKEIQIKNESEPLLKLPVRKARINKQKLDIEPSNGTTTNEPLLLQSFCEQIPLDPRYFSPLAIDEHRSDRDINNSENNVNIQLENQVDQVQMDSDPAESPNQSLIPLTPAPITENLLNNDSSDDTISRYNVIQAEASNSAPDPTIENSSADLATKNDVNIQDNLSLLADNNSNSVPEAIQLLDKEVMDQIMTDEIPTKSDLATAMDVTQDDNNIDTNNNTDINNMDYLNQDMTEVFQEIFPEYYSNNCNKNNEQQNDENPFINNDRPIIPAIIEEDTSNIAMETYTDGSAIQQKAAEKIVVEQGPVLAAENNIVQKSEENTSSGYGAGQTTNCFVTAQNVFESTDAIQTSIIGANDAHMDQNHVETNNEQQAKENPILIEKNAEQLNNYAIDAAPIVTFAVDQSETRSSTTPAQDHVGSMIQPQQAENIATEQPSVEKQEILTENQSVLESGPEVKGATEVENNQTEEANQSLLTENEPVESDANHAKEPSSINTNEPDRASIDPQTIAELRPQLITSEVLDDNSEEPNINEYVVETVTNNNIEILREIPNANEEQQQQPAEAMEVDSITSLNNNNNNTASVPEKIQERNEAQERTSELKITPEVLETISNNVVVPEPIAEEIQLQGESTDQIGAVVVQENNTNVDVEIRTGNNAADAINVEDEIPNLNEIIYDGEVVIESDEDVPLIDFFGAQIVVDGDNNNTNMVDNMDIKVEGENTRKRKRGFSLEGLRLRRVKPKLEQNEISPEISSPLRANETLEDIEHSTNDNPILRAIYSSRLRSNNNNNNNQRRASSYESRIKIEKKETDSQEECPDSTRVLVYAERHTPGRKRNSTIRDKKTKEKSPPKKFTKPKKEAKGEKTRIKSEEEPEIISGDEDSVEYHVDKLCEDEYFVEEILEKKVTKGKTKYLIKWLGWPHEDNSWTDAADISPDIVADYEKMPDKRRPGERNNIVYNLFWKYAFRRHVRYVKEHPEDPNYERCKDIDVADGLLDKYSMCNCYRELDAGSIYFKEQVAKMKEEEEDEDKIDKQIIWMSFCYRLINRVSTFQQFGRIPTWHQWPEFKKFLLNIRAMGNTVFTNKHNVIGLDNYIATIDHISSIRNKLYSEFLKLNRKIQKCLEHALTIPFIGPFFAQQICNDLVAEGVLKGSDTWVCLGPGAKSGIRSIYPGIKKPEMLEKARQLQKSQRKAFKALEFDFPFHEGRDMSLVDIEHVLCEFQKYLRMLGKKKGRTHWRSGTKPVKKARRR